MNFPLQLVFKTIALTPQLSVTDASGQLVFYVKQKAFKLKESVTVFGDVERTRPLYTINADRVFDISAQYHFTNHEGVRLGAVKRQGMRSFWKAHYDVLHEGETVMTIREENAWVKVIDGIVGEIPIVGMFTGYLLHPAYQIVRTDGTVLLRAEKQPAFWEGKYTIEKLAELAAIEEELAVLSVLMMLLLERRRG